MTDRIRAASDDMLSLHREAAAFVASQQDLWKKTMLFSFEVSRASLEASTDLQQKLVKNWTDGLVSGLDKVAPAAAKAWRNTMATDDLGKLSGEWYRQWEDGVTKWWDAVLDNPTFVKGMGDNLANQSRARAKWEEGVERSMEAMHLPSKKDLVRVARIASLLEDRVVAVEDRVLGLTDQLDRIEKETLKARVADAEGQLRIEDRLAAIEDRLDRIVAALGAESAARPAARRKKE